MHEEGGHEKLALTMLFQKQNKRMKQEMDEEVVVQKLVEEISIPIFHK